MMLTFYVVVVFLILLISQEIFRRFPRFALGVFIFLPLILVPYWIQLGIREWFFWIKIFSISIGMIMLLIFILFGEKKTLFFRRLIYIFLIMNILEAVIKDLQGTGLAHFLNALAGTLLIITIDNVSLIRIAKNKINDVLWDDMRWGWIIGYTFWNWTFVYLNFAQISAQAIAVLGVPLFVAFFNKSRWFQTRVFTLAIYMMLSFSFQRLSSAGYSRYWLNERIVFCFSLLSFVYMCIYAINFIVFFDRQKLNRG